MNNLIVPKENVEVYCYLYKIENAIRELIIDLLQNYFGPIWYKTRLPTDVLERYKSGIKYERDIKWTQLIPYHPIYYIEFPDLRKIIERTDNWDDVFKTIFGSRKEIIISTLTELEPIRNKIAHNRKITFTDLKIVRGAYTKISEIIGKEKLNQLASRCTCILDIIDQLANLQKEGEGAHVRCINCKILDKLEIWTSIKNKWWFDGSYLGQKLESIIDYFKTIEEYTNLSRTRGSGYKIEAWVKANAIVTKYKNAQIEFSKILKRN